MILIIIDENFMSSAFVIRRMLQNFGVPSRVVPLNSIQEGIGGKAFINKFDAAIFLQSETNENNRGNKRFYTWVSYEAGDKPLAHFGCVNRLAGSSSQDYNTTLGALSPAFPIVRFNPGNVLATSFLYPSLSDFPLSSGVESVTGVNGQNYRLRGGGTRLIMGKSGHKIWTRVATLRTGSGYGLFRYNPSLLDEDREVVLRVEIPDELSPEVQERFSTAAAGIRYFNRYFLPCLGARSNAMVCEPMNEGTSFNWLWTTSIHLVLWFLKEVGISPDSYGGERMPVTIDHDHPIDDFTAVFPGSLAEQRIRRRRNEYMTYSWLNHQLELRNDLQIQIGVNTGGRDRPRVVSGDPKTHWQALHSTGPENPPKAREFASLLNNLLIRSRCFQCCRHDHTREKNTYNPNYLVFPRHFGGAYGTGNALPESPRLLPTHSADIQLTPKIPPHIIDDELSNHVWEESNLFEMVALGFRDATCNHYVNNSRNSEGGRGGRAVANQWGINAIRITDSHVEGNTSEYGNNDWRVLQDPHYGLHFVLTPSTSFDCGNKGLLEDDSGATSENEMNANNLWGLRVPVARSSQPTFEEKRKARARLMCMMGDRIMMVWLLYAGIPYWHGSNAHSAKPQNPTEDFEINGNWNAMKELHQCVFEYIDAYSDWIYGSSAEELIKWRRWMARQLR